MTSPSQETPAEAQCAVQAVPAGSLAVLATLTAGELREAEERIYAPLVIPPEPRWLPGWPEYDACRTVSAAEMEAGLRDGFAAARAATYDSPWWRDRAEQEGRDRDSFVPPVLADRPRGHAAVWQPQPAPRFVAAPEVPNRVEPPGPRPGPEPERRRRWRKPPQAEPASAPEGFGPPRPGARHRKSGAYVPPPVPGAAVPDPAIDEPMERFNAAHDEEAAAEAERGATAQMTQYLAAPGAAEGERDQ